MNKKITELLDLPTIEEEATEIVDSLKDQYIQKNDHEKSMDDIYSETLSHASSIMEMGYNVDPRSRSALFEKANMLYNTALNAKNSKEEIRLKKIKLELERKKLELDEKKFNRDMDQNSENSFGENVMIIDRNELLKKFKEQKDKDK